MSELTDLELCKKIAEIDGVSVTQWSSSRGASGYSTVNVEGGVGVNYNPLTNKALLFDLMVKYKVELNHNQEDSNLAVIWPSDIETSNLIGNYFVEFKCDADIPRAILECIVEANKNG